MPDPSNPQDLNRFSYVRNNPIRYNDPTGHFCSDPEDLWSPGCDGSGTPPPVTTPPPAPAPVVIVNPDPLDDGQEQDDPAPTPSLDPHDDGNTLPIDPLTTTTPVTQTPSTSGPNWYTIAAGVAVVAISLVAISLIVAGVIITGGTAAGIAIIAGEMLLSTEIWLFISITAGSLYVGYQGIQLIGEGIEGK